MVGSSGKLGSRIPELDALRGFALLGILVVNILVFHAPYSHYGAFYGAFEGSEARVVDFVVNYAGGKFMFIFALLFGMGVAFQLRSKKASFMSYHGKRMLVLSLFGAIHILVFWFGDILLTYGLLGFAFLLFARLPKILALSIGLLMVFFRPLYYMGAVWWGWPMVGLEEPPAELEHFAEVFQNGSYWEIFLLRMKELWTFMPENLVWYISKALGVMLLGYASVQYGVLQKLRGRQGLYLAIALALLAIGVAWMELRVMAFELVDLEVMPLARPFFISLNVLVETYMGAAYIILMILLFQVSPRVSRLFEPLGKLALSNYILQSVICVLVFYGYGAGYYMQLKPSQLMLITLGIFAGQTVLSHLYLSKFKQGPLEKLWRASLGSNVK